MQQFFRSHFGRGPVAQIFGLIVGALFITAAFFVGLAFISVLFGAAAIIAVTMAIRTWWLSRKLRGSGSGTKPDIIEVEYHVVESPPERRDDR